MGVYSWRDWIVALLVFLVASAVAVGSLEAGLTNWGDDSAAYISEGIAIAEGRFDEQTRINYFYHPTPLPPEARDGRLVYVWGYPLAVAAVYRLAGFDREGYSSILWYKLPQALCLGLLGAVLTLFLRRRFSIWAGAALALVLCASRGVLNAVNTLYADLPFMFLSMTALWLMECYADTPAGRGRVALGAVYGLFLFLTHETRLNGLTVCAVALLGHALALARAKERPDRRTLAAHLAPYLLFAALALAAEHLWLAPATGNTSDITATQFAVQARHYAELLLDWLATLFGRRRPWLGYVVAGLCLLGLVTDGLGKNLHLTLLVAGTFLVLGLLWYQQGLRYLYNVLPLLLMYALYGLAFIARQAGRLLGEKGRVGLRWAGVALAVALLALSFSHRVPAVSDNVARWGRIGKKDVYCPDAVEMYRYIQDNVPPDSVICFGKPRSLYLNTGRRSFRWGQNGHDITDADYYLRFSYKSFGDNHMDQSILETLPVEMQNGSFTLYRVE